MAGIDLKQLVSRLNEPCRRALEAAAGLTLSRTHYNVEIEHWLVTLADRADGDVAAILRHYEIDPGRFTVDLNEVVERISGIIADADHCDRAPVAKVVRLSCALGECLRC